MQLTRTEIFVLNVLNLTILNNQIFREQSPKPSLQKKKIKEVTANPETEKIRTELNKKKTKKTPGILEAMHDSGGCKSPYN